jgi:hypothetical protein
LTKAPKTYDGKNPDSSTNVAGENCLSACRRLKLDTCLSSCTNINSKWIKDLKTWPGTLKLLQERAGNTLEQIGIGNDFLNRTLMAQ